MDATNRKPWLRVVVLVGAVYLLVGIVFALPANHVRAWRLAEWVVSGAAYAIHVGYECLRLHNSSQSAARHVASAVALGALGLAVAANVHSIEVATSSEHQRLLFVALGVWPLITGVPAFLVGLGVCGLLVRFSRRGHSE